MIDWIAQRQNNDFMNEDSYFADGTTIEQARQYFLRTISLYRSSIGHCEVCQKQIVIDALQHKEEYEELILQECDLQDLRNLLRLCLANKKKEIEYTLEGFWGACCDYCDSPNNTQIDEALDKAIPF